MMHLYSINPPRHQPQRPVNDNEPAVLADGRTTGTAILLLGTFVFVGVALCLVGIL